MFKTERKGVIMKGYDIQKRRVDLKRNQVNHIEMKRCLLTVMCKKKEKEKKQTRVSQQSYARTKE